MVLVDALYSVANALSSMIWTPSISDKFLSSSKINSSPLLTTNKLPTQREADQIRDYLHYAYSKVNLLSRRMKLEVDDEVEQQLYEERKELQAFVTKLERVVSPARRPPPEVWRNVFRHCEIDPLNSLNKDCAPILLTRVSSTWRKIAMEDPILWSRIRLRLHDVIKNDTVRRVEWFLKLSQNIPLDVKFNSRSWHPPPPNTDAWLNKPTILAFVGHVQRIQELTLPISCNANAQQYQLIAQMRNNMPKLRKLVIGTPEPMPGFMPIGRLDVFEEAPLLREVVIYHCVPLAHLVLPKSPITNFRITQTVSYSDVGRILSAFPELETFVGSIRAGDPEEPVTHQPKYSHSTLSSFVLHRSDNRRLGQDFRLIVTRMKSFPNLKHVILPVVERYKKETIAFMLSKAESIRKVELTISYHVDEGEVAPQTLMNYLRAGKYIEHLIVKEGNPTKKLPDDMEKGHSNTPCILFCTLDGLTDHYKQPPSLLYLTHLTVETGVVKTHDSLIRFIKSRKKDPLIDALTGEHLTPARLQEVTLYVPANALEPERIRYKDILALADENLKVTVWLRTEKGILLEVS